MVLSIFPNLIDFYDALKDPESKSTTHLSFTLNIIDNLRKFGRNEVSRLVTDSTLSHDLASGLSQNE
jgi:hypothetical protein